jgi:hypothetical protein
LTRENLQRHHQRECNKIELTCPFTQFGCQFKGLRPEYNKHLIEDSDLHVGIVIEREATMTEEIGKLKNELERANNNKPQQDNIFGFKPAFGGPQQQPKNDGFAFKAPNVPQQAAPSPFTFAPQQAPQFNFGPVHPFGNPAQEPQPQPFSWNFNNNGNGNDGSPFKFK